MDSFLKKQIAQRLASKDRFLCMYGRSTLTEKIYTDILRVVTEAVDKKLSLPAAVQVLSVYCAVLGNKHPVTLREAFYQTKRFFVSYRSFTAAVFRIASKLEITESALGIAPSLKGLVYGSLCIRTRRGHVFLSGESVIPHMEGAESVVCSAEVVLVVEKEAVFRLVLQELRAIEKAARTKILLVTGKGYPCRNTLRLLMHLAHLRVVGVFDCDAYGLCIYRTYKYGSRRHPLLRIPCMERIGVFLSETKDFSLLLSISQATKEYSLLVNLSALPELQKDTGPMLEKKKKASIEDVLQSTSIVQYLSAKLREHASFFSL
ncbi:meiotic recombination protein SPO11 [Nematocida sp. AWRm77]|nr:meiotic recombination protein SPO11 [Nematocida sp. AWRm77]